MKRSASLKRAPIKRRSTLRRARKSTPPQPGREEWKTPQAGYCQCGCERFSMHLDRHHVLLAQRIVKEGRPELLWDMRNSMLLLPDHHSSHHSGMRKIHLSRVPEKALEFCTEVIGRGAMADYFHRRYNCDIEGWEDTA